MDEIKPYQPLTILAPGGFGDLMWLMVAIANIKKVYKIPHLTICVGGTGSPIDQRAVEFLKKFSMVDEIYTKIFKLLKDPWLINNRVNYIDNGYNPDGTYNLFINGHLEWLGRLEKFMPELNPGWDIITTGYRIDEKDTNFALSHTSSGYFLNEAKNSYICLYMCTKQCNTNCGMNNDELWSIYDWAALLRSLRKMTNLPFYVIGNKNDHSYAQEVLNYLRDDNTFNICGRTNGTQVVEMLRNCTLCIGFASGMPIISTYMGVPTVMFWRPEGTSHSPDYFVHFSDSFATNWIPPGSLNRWYFPAVYTVHSPDDIIAAIRKFFIKKVIKFA